MQLQPHLDPYVKARTFLDNFASAKMEIQARTNFPYLTTWTRYFTNCPGQKEAYQLHAKEGRKSLPALISCWRLLACLKRSKGLLQVDLVGDALPGVRLLERSLQTLNEWLLDLWEKQWEPLYTTKRCWAQRSQRSADSGLQMKGAQTVNGRMDSCDRWEQSDDLQNVEIWTGAFHVAASRRLHEPQACSLVTVLWHKRLALTRTENLIAVIKDVKYHLLVLADRNCDILPVVGCWDQRWQLLWVDTHQEAHGRRIGIGARRLWHPLKSQSVGWDKQWGAHHSGRRVAASRLRHSWQKQKEEAC